MFHVHRRKLIIKNFVWIGWEQVGTKGKLVERKNSFPRFQWWRKRSEGHMASPTFFRVHWMWDKLTRWVKTINFHSYPQLFHILHSGKVVILQLNSYDFLFFHHTPYVIKKNYIFFDISLHPKILIYIIFSLQFFSYFYLHWSTKNYKINLI